MVMRLRQLSSRPFPYLVYLGGFAFWFFSTRVRAQPRAVIPHFGTQLPAIRGQVRSNLPRGHVTTHLGTLSAQIDQGPAGSISVSTRQDPIVPSRQQDIVTSIYSHDSSIQYETRKLYSSTTGITFWRDSCLFQRGITSKMHMG